LHEIHPSVLHESRPKGFQPVIRFSPPIRFLALAGAFVLALGCVACKRPAPPPKLVNSWHPVHTWTGSANQQTESFVSETGAFRAHWTARNTDPAHPGLFKLTLHSAVSGRPLVPMVEHRGDGDETTYASEDPREFFLLIEADGIEWSVALDEAFQTLQAAKP
jgi:hypothetical protein